MTLVENDEMIGNKNKFNSERPPSVSITNTHNLSSSVGKIPQIYALKLAGQLNSVCSKGSKFQISPPFNMIFNIAVLIVF